MQAIRAAPTTPTWTATSSQTPATCTASRRATRRGLSVQSSYFNANTPAAPATPTEVEVDAVPIVVESTTDDYFVLYVRHKGTRTTSVELPVLVKKGEAGTTTLAANLEALPKERYRVEKYLIDTPADIDGDGVDDISDPNPVNPAADCMS